MFNGNINNKHYTNPDEFYEDLKKLSLKGENFTVSASCSCSNEEAKPITAKKELKTLSNFDSFVKGNVIDLEWLKNEYKTSQNKDAYIQKLKSAIPCILDEDEADKLSDFTYDELVSLIELVSRKKSNLDNQKFGNRKDLSEIDETFEVLDAERTEVYNKLKSLNKDAEDLMKIREEHECIDIMVEVLESAYDSLIDAIDTELESREIVEDIKNVCEETPCDDEELEDVVDEEEENKDDEDYMVDILSSFKKLYELFSK